MRLRTSRMNVMTVPAFTLACFLCAAIARAQTSQPAPANDAKPTIELAPNTGTNQCGRHHLAGQDEEPVDTEEWIEKSKHPAPWISWGADLRLRNIYTSNVVLLDGRNPNHERHFQRYRPRWWTTISPAETLDFNLRLVWEGRHYCKPDAFEECDGGDVLFDQLNVAVKKPFDLPVTITGGRQDLIFGDRWLIFDGTPLDGSRTIYFDAIRATTALDDIKTTIDLVYIDQDAEGEHWIKPLKDRDTNSATGLPGRNYVTEQNERGAILWVTNKSLARTELNGYFIYKNDRKVMSNGHDADIYTFGGRGVHDLTDHWKARAELASQFGHLNDARLAALGGNSRLSYHFKDAHDNSLRLHYEYRSGDKPGTSRSEAFDPLWGRWPRFSELYIYTNAGENRVGDPANMHRVAAGWTTKPVEKVEMCTDYHLLFADQNSYRNRPLFSDSGCFRGQLLTWLLRYTINPHLKGHTVAEFFFPGDYYADTNNDPAVFLRTELVFTW